MPLRNKIIKNLEELKEVKIETVKYIIKSCGVIIDKINANIPLEKLDKIANNLTEIKNLLNIF